MRSPFAHQESCISGPTGPIIPSFVAVSKFPIRTGLSPRPFSIKVSPQTAFSPLISPLAVKSPPVDSLILQVPLISSEGAIIPGTSCISLFPVFFVFSIFISLAFFQSSYHLLRSFFFLKWSRPNLGVDENR